jgi:hypothetical protein
MTFSAADIHWQSLQKHLPRYDEWLAVDHKSKLSIFAANLRDKPHIAAYHFHQRFLTLLNTFLRQKFGITDY